MRTLFGTCAALLVGLAGCGGHAAESASLPAHPHAERRHDFSSELAWVDERGAEEVDEAEGALADEGRPAAEALELAREALEPAMADPALLARALFAWGRAAEAAQVRTDAERAFLAYVCRERTPTPLRTGALPPARAWDDPFRGCTPVDDDPERLAIAFAGLGHLAATSWDHPTATRAYLHALAQEGAPPEARAAVLLALASFLARLGDRTASFDAFTRAAVLEAPPNHLVLTEIANAIVDDDWNRDGRKDSRSGLTRPEVAAWLATSPRDANAVILRAAEVATGTGRCEAARRTLRVLARRGPEGAALANRARPAVDVCR